jgi:hypothetical protein
MVWQNVVDGLIGIWFIIAPWVLRLTYNPSEMWTSIAGGAILVVLAGSAAAMPRARRQLAIQYITGLVGIWFIIAPWILSLTGRPDLTWTSIVGGLIVLILSSWLAFGAVPRVLAERR